MNSNLCFHSGSLDQAASLGLSGLRSMCGGCCVQHFLGRKEFQEMQPGSKVEMLERRECIREYKGPCSHMGEFMIQVWGPHTILNQHSF